MNPYAVQRLRDSIAAEPWRLDMLVHPENGDTSTPDEFDAVFAELHGATPDPRPPRLSTCGDVLTSGDTLNLAVWACAVLEPTTPLRSGHLIHQSAMTALGLHYSEGVRLLGAHDALVELDAVTGAMAVAVLDRLLRVGRVSWKRATG